MEQERPNQMDQNKRSRKVECPQKSCLFRATKIWTNNKTIRLLETILYEEAFSLFGIKTKEKNVRKPSRRLEQIKDVRHKIKDLVKAMKSCSYENEYEVIVCLMNVLKKRKQVLRFAEHSWK